MVKKFKTFGPQLVFAEQTAVSVVVLTNEQKLSLYKKSQKSGISTDILEEVYRRGYSIWNESFGQTVEQFAFDRVNSFIAGGFAANLDEDLMIDEGKRGLWDNIHAKQERIKHGSGEHMRKPGSKGAPSKDALKAAQTEAFNPAQQAAIAIAMKKAGKKPKNEETDPFSICETADAGLAAKASKSGISIGTLRKVYRRGVAAWNSGHRPGTTPQQWGMARVNSYISHGSGTYGGADKDLHEGDTSKLPRVAKDKESGLAQKYVAGLSSSTAKARAAHWKKMDQLSDSDPRAYEPAPGDATAKTKPSKYTLKYHAMYGESIDEEILEACWNGYRQVGVKMKNGKQVPNCVAIKEDEQEDLRIANAAAVKKLRGGRDIELPSPEEIEKRNEFAKGVGDAALSLHPVTGLTKTAYDTYGDVKQGNYEDAAKTAGVGIASAILGPAAKLAGTGIKKVIGFGRKLVREDTTYETIRKVILEKQQGVKLHTGKHFKNNETVETQSKDPNDPDSRFDGTKSAKNVYQKITPGQPVTEATGDEAKAALNDRSKVLDNIVSQSQQAQNPPVKTNASQTSDRREFNSGGEVKTMTDNSGTKYNTTVPNQAVKKVAPSMTNALTAKAVKRIVKEYYVCENCDCGLYEELLNERGADSKGYYRSTESGAGLTAKGAAHFGIQTAVTEKQPSGKRAARRRSFCARMSGMKGPMKDEKGRPTRKAMSLRRWRC